MDYTIPEPNQLMLTPYKPLTIPISDLKLIVSPIKQETDIYSELVRDPTPKKKLNFYDESISETPISYMLPSSQDSEQHLSSENIREHEYYDNLNTVKKCSAIFSPNYLSNNQPNKVTPKPCHCSRSKCQKKYCDCYSMGYICSQLCECVDCQNSFVTVQHSHKKTQVKCKCEKSHCMKNYCECHKAGKKCSSQCNCLQCMNNQDHQDSQFNKGKTPSKRIKRQPGFIFMQ